MWELTLSLLHINMIQCYIYICWTGLFWYISLCNVSDFFFITISNLFYKIKLKKHLHSWIFIGADGNKNLNYNWFYIHIISSYIPFVTDDLKKIHFLMFYSGRRWILRRISSSKFWFLGQISIYDFITVSNNNFI